MITVAVQLSEPLHARIEELAKAQSISVNQFLATAAAEKMAALFTQDYPQRKDTPAKREDFERVLMAVPDVEPEARDRR